MANLSVRKVDENVYEQLQRRAASHGISMEEEVRRILSQAVSAPESIYQVFHHHFGSHNPIDLDNVLPRHQPHEPMEFDE